MYAGLTFLAISLITLVQPKVLDDDMLLYWRKSGDSAKCQPFTSYFISCNKCVCSAEGIAFCTRMACFKTPRFLLDDSKNIEPINKPDFGPDPANEASDLLSKQKVN